MNTVSIVEIITKDNLIHQGLYAEPTKKTGHAILWIHGLSSNFYGNTVKLQSMVEACRINGIGFAAFNTRGHDGVCGIKKIDTKNWKKQTRVVGGSGNERFEECVYDIDSGITFLKEKGYKKITLAGSSTGANKACFYAGTQNDPRLSAVVLASPVCDRLAFSRQTSWLAKIAIATLRGIGLGNTFMTFAGPYPVTPNRALSLMTPHSKEDVFDYDDNENGLKIFGKITKPLLILLAEQDEFLDRPAFVVKSVFDKKTKVKQYRSTILKDADHGFDGKEKEFANTIIRWLQSINV